MSIKAYKDNTVFISNSYLQEDGKKASATIKYMNNPTDGQIIILSGTTYTYRISPAVDNEVAIGANIGASIDNLLKKVLPAKATYKKVGADSIFIEYVTDGTIGNSFTIASNFIAMPISLSGGTDERDLDWVDNTPAVVYKLPMLYLGNEGNLMPIQTSSTALVTYNMPVAEGDPVKVYNDTDGLVEGSLGATTTTTIASSKSLVDNKTVFSNAGGSWTINSNSIVSGNGGHSTNAHLTASSKNVNGISIIDTTAGLDYSVTGLLGLIDKGVGYTPYNHYTVSWQFRGVFIFGTNISSGGKLSNAYDNFNEDVTYHPAGSLYVDVQPRIINDVSSLGYNDAYYNYWANRGYFQRARLISNNTYYWVHTQKGYNELNPIVGTNKNQPFSLALVAEKINNTVSVVVNDVVVTSLDIGGTRNYQTLDTIIVADQDYSGNPSWQQSFYFQTEVTNYTSDITSLGLLNPPIKAWLDKSITVSTVAEANKERCIAQDVKLTPTGTPTLTNIVATSSIRGLLKTGDSILVDGVLIEPSSIIETDLGGGTYKYDISFDTALAQAPTALVVPDRSITHTEVSDTYDNINDKFNKIYNKVEQQGRAFKYKIEADRGVEITKVFIELSKEGE